ncbi:MAG: helix-turn-helix transcriptional regulator [Flavobacteriaceae bacterium]|nr:helix-turn-helix transcriptional regulator [Flavobacteriaceae bacterium]
MNIDKIISNLRKSKNWSQADLASKSKISQVMVGKYERGDAIPSIEVAKKIADAFEVSLDYLIGEGQNVTFDKKTIQRIQNIQTLDINTQNILFNLIDTYIQNFKTKQAFVS